MLPLGSSFHKETPHLNLLNLAAFNHDVKQCLREHQQEIDKEKLERIHPQSYIYKNSVNILVGKQGSGKTFTCAYEIAKISQIHNETHLLIIVCKDENQQDPTIRSLSKMINIPIEYVCEEDAEQYMRKLLMYKRLYDTVKEHQYEDRIDPSQRDELFDVLKISDFSRDYLHTILLFNDIAKSKLFNRATNYFNQLLPICRHIQCSFFLNVQFWKSLPPELKANATTVVIFGGFDVRQLYYIFSQVPTSLSVKNILPEYQSLRKHDKLIVDAETGDIYLDNSL